jgi:hypothetical protein
MSQPIRQYKILYKRGLHDWATLEPGVHTALYELPVVAAGVETLRANPAFVGLVVSFEGALFNLVSFTQPAIAPQAFIFAS